MVYKPFDKNLFEHNDQIAREAVKDYFHSQYNVSIKDNPDKYEPDLILFHEDKMYGYIECEIKLAWKEGKFPWPLV